MTRFVSRWRVALAASLVAAGIGSARLDAEPLMVASNDTVALEEIKHEAFSALLLGRFDQTGELLERAASLSDDPALGRMSRWVSEYLTQQQAIAAEKAREFDLAVGKVHTLVEAGMPSFAADYLAIAFLHAADRDAFRAEPWVAQMIRQIESDAAAAQTSEDWLTARRLYGVLGSIEPVEPKWRVAINDVSRRLRLLMMYAPDSLESRYKAEAELRKKVNELVEPDRSAEASGADEEVVLDDAFKLDWKKMLEGVRADMLRDALEQVRASYWRDVTARELVEGGVRGVRELVNTHGLESAFPGIADASQKAAFERSLDEILTATSQLSDRRQIQAAIDAVVEVNRVTLNLPSEVVIAEFADGAMSKLDPFSNVIWPWDVGEFIKNTSGEFTGVGIQINQSDDGWLTVVSPIEDTPAYRAGLKPGDIISHINGRSAKGVSTTQAVKHITGPKGTSVTLTIRSPDGESHDVVLIRDTIKVDSVRGWLHKPGGGWDYLVDPDNGIAYVRMTSFTRETGEELRAACEQLEADGAKAIVLDLRYNPGGVLGAAAAVVDQFIPGGVIVSRRNDRGVAGPTLQAQRRSNDVSLPMVVLVNQSSASASEIVSGALNDHNRALIIGERTFGKGSVQEIIPLAGGRALLKLTTSHYYLPNGEKIHREDTSTKWGVEPDLVIDMTPEQMRQSNKARQQLDVLRDAGSGDPEAVAKLQQELLAADPQISAAILVLRMQLAGAPLM